MNYNDLICPVCENSLSLNDSSLICEKNHLFNISKKGSLVLVKKPTLYKSKLYSKSLFINRRKFICSGVYEQMYKIIAKELSELTEKELKILDLGCGEGTHLVNIMNKISMKDVFAVGIDYSKDAIEIATDFLDVNRLFVVGDVNFLPLKTNSVDVVLNILSPYNEKEINRVLKNNGIFIKVTPGKEYLKELRNDNNLEEYKKEEEVKNNIINKFKVIKHEILNYKFQFENDIKGALIEMTPLLKKVDNKKVNDNLITINLNIYILKKETKK